MIKCDTCEHPESWHTAAGLAYCRDAFACDQTPRDKAAAAREILGEDAEAWAELISMGRPSVPLPAGTRDGERLRVTVDTTRLTAIERDYVWDGMKWDRFDDFREEGDPVLRHAPGGDE